LSITSDQYRALMERVGAVPVTTQLADGRSYTIWTQGGASSAGQGGGSSSASNDDELVFSGSAPSQSASGTQGASGGQGASVVEAVPGVQFLTTVSPRETTGSTQLRIADRADVPSVSDLLLVDQVLARFATDEDDDADPAPVACGDESDQESELELALAAAFEENVDWRNSL
jgi:hypothetical protein